MKKNLFVIIVLIIILLCGCVSDNATSSLNDMDLGIHITDELFPDYIFREFISNYIDKDNNDYISDEENRCVKSLSCTRDELSAVIIVAGSKEAKCNTDNSNKNKGLHYDGIQCFKYVETLNISSIDDCFYSDTIEIKEFGNLKKIIIESRDDELEIQLCDLICLDQVEINNIASKYCDMHHIDGGEARYNKLVVDNTPNLEVMSVGYVKDIDLGKCDSLKLLYFDNVFGYSVNDIYEKCPQLGVFDNQ